MTTKPSISDKRIPEIGETIVGRYRLVRLIGEGGFASVFEAVDTRASGRVAIKVLRPEKSLEANFANRFRQEVRLVRQLKHPNTIKVSDTGTCETGCLFLVMEYVTGTRLDDFVERNAPLGPVRVMKITEQILKSLAEAHEKGIIHRDLKPGNIMIGHVAGEDDFVKVLDFGVAKALEPTGPQVKTQTDAVFCTPRYAAPELLKARGVSPASDVYSLGLIMLEMLTGQPVINEPTDADIIAVQLSPAPIPIPTPIAPTPLGGVLAQATAKPAKKRYANASEMLDDLRRARNRRHESGSYVGVGKGVDRDEIATGDTKRYSTDQHPTLYTGPAKTKRSIPPALIVGFVVTLVCLVAFVVLRFQQEKTSPIPGPPDADFSELTESSSDAEETVFDVEEVHTVDTPPQTGWQGRVVEPLFGAGDGTGEPVRGELGFVQQQKIDTAIGFSLEAYDMLREALRYRQLTSAFHIEAQLDHLQLLSNLVQMYCSLEFCDAASRLLNNAFDIPETVTADSVSLATDLRTAIGECDDRSDRPEWRARDYRTLIEEAFELADLAALPDIESDDQSELLFQSIQLRSRALLMLQSALMDDEIEGNAREDAVLDLVELYQQISIVLLDLDMRQTCAVILDSMLEHVTLFPEDRREQVVDLQIRLRHENQQAIDSLLAELPASDGDDWPWGRYQHLLQRSDDLVRTAIEAPEP